jgi:hypothetical protein
VKLVVLNDAGEPVAEIDDLEHYDLSTVRGRAMLIDEITLALGQGDRRKVLQFMRHSQDGDGAVDSLPD